MGVAKNLFNTSVCLKEKKTNAVPNTPALMSEKPSMPGKTKSMALYSLPLIGGVSRISAVTVAAPGFACAIVALLLSVFVADLQFRKSWASL